MKNRLKYQMLMVIALLWVMHVFVSAIEPQKGISEKRWTPTLESWVTDLASVFTPEQKVKLIKSLSAYEKETRHQLALLTVRSLKGEAIESFSLRVANSFGLGMKEYNNGILVTMSMSEKRIRIELGLGMEKYISDDTALKIIRSDFVPAFKKGKFYEGVVAGLNSLMAEARKYKIPKNRK